MLDTLNTTTKNWLEVGDPVRLHSDTNRMRRHVMRVCNDYEVEIALHLRSSRGWRRHVRRMKAARR